MLRFFWVGAAFVVAAFLPVGVHGCNKNADCSSGWCEGGTLWSSGRCGAKLANGALAPAWLGAVGWDYNKCAHGNGECGTCGPKGSTWVNQKCEQNAQCKSGMQCNSWDSTLTGTTAGCTGACKPKIADGQECSQALLTGGMDDQCASNKCLELLKNTCSKCRYCQPRGGSTDGQRCTEDKDCALAVGSGLWCDGGGLRDGRPQAGWCRACPSTCSAGEGCHACDNDKSKMACGRSSLSEKASCAGEVAVEAITKLLDCFGLSTDGAMCALNLAKEIADCAGGGDCDVEFGDPCLDMEHDASLGGDRRSRSLNGTLAARAPKQNVEAVHDLSIKLDGEDADAESDFNVPDDEDEDEPSSLNAGVRSRRATWGLSDMLTTTGSAEAKAKTRFVVNPKTLQSSVTFEATLDVKAQLKISASKTNADNGVEKEKPLTKGKKILFKKFMLIGHMPIYTEISVRPYLFYTISSSAEFTGTLDVSASTSVTAGIILDARGKKVTPSFTVSEPRPTITPAAGARGSMSIKARIGLRWTFSVNMVPIKLDTTIALYLNAEAMYLQGEPAFDTAADGGRRRDRRSGCLEGTVSFSAGVDLRINVKFEVPSPLEMAHQACMTGAGMVNNIPGVEAAQCLADNFGADLPKPEDVCTELETEEVASGSELPNSYCNPTLENMLTGDWIHYPMATGSAALSICSSSTPGSPFEVKASATAQMSLPCSDTQGSGPRVSTVKWAPPGVQKSTGALVAKAAANKAYADAKCDTDLDNGQGLWTKMGCDKLEAAKTEAAAALTKAKDAMDKGELFVYTAVARGAANKAYADAKCDTDVSNEQGLWSKAGCTELEAAKAEGAAALDKAYDALSSTERVTQMTLLKDLADKAYADAKCDTDPQNEQGLWNKAGCDELKTSKTETAKTLATAKNTITVPTAAAATPASSRTLYFATCIALMLALAAPA